MAMLVYQKVYIYIYYYNPSIDDYLYVTNHYYWYYNHY